MLSQIIGISEFATKLVGGLSGMLIAIAVVVIVVVKHYQKPKAEDGPVALKRKAKQQNEELALKEAQKKEKKDKKNKKNIVEAESGSSANPQTNASTENPGEN